jgi:proline dehydrogenase
MLRAILIYLSHISWAQRFISRWSFTWRVASRFIAGETRDEAVRTAKKLNELGINTSLDYLGEAVKQPEEAINAAQEVVSLVQLIETNGVRSNVSIKLSQLGMNIDLELCRNNMTQILAAARDCNNFIRIDMEDSSLTEATLEIFFWLRDQGYENVGIVIQSYLYRSEEDIAKLSQFGARVRLCKGAYNEPAEVAFPKKTQVNRNFDLLTDALFRNAVQMGNPIVSDNGCIPPIPGIATHDQKRIDHSLATAKELQLPDHAFEFQFLYGIRRDLQQDLVQRGYPVRVYIPYGTHWYPYFMRRLAERPANLWFFISRLFRK